jgi:hypothetical protein
MKLSPIVNTDTKMPKKMFDALALHETFCVVSKIDTVTAESVVQHLTEKHGAAFAAGFKPEFLLNSQAT